MNASDLPPRRTLDDAKDCKLLADFINCTTLNDRGAERRDRSFGVARGNHKAKPGRDTEPGKPCSAASGYRNAATPLRIGARDQPHPARTG